MEIKEEQPYVVSTLIDLTIFREYLISSVQFLHPQAFLLQYCSFISLTERSINKMKERFTALFQGEHRAHCRTSKFQRELEATAIRIRQNITQEIDLFIGKYSCTLYFPLFMFRLFSLQLTCAPTSLRYIDSVYCMY